MSVLVLFTAVKKGNENFAKNILLNTSRIIDFYVNPSNAAQTILYYKVDSNTTWQFTVSHTPATVSTRIYEDSTNPVRKLHIVSQKTGSLAMDKPVNAMRYVVSDSVIWGYDISTTQSYLFCDRGNSEIRLKLSHIVADISRSYSTSVSLSQS